MPGASSPSLSQRLNKDPDGQNYGLVVMDMATNYLRATTCRPMLSCELFTEMKERETTKWKSWTAIWCNLREKIRMATLSRRRLFDLQRGQKVLLWTRKAGPYPVAETRGSVTTILRNGVNFKAATANLKPFHELGDHDDDSDGDVEYRPGLLLITILKMVPHRLLQGPMTLLRVLLMNQMLPKLDQPDADDRILEIGSIRVVVDPNHRYLLYTSIAGYIVNCDENSVTIIPFVDPTNRMIEAESA
ncbi:hypothetical protein FOZ60_010822 [Perkinsus olseni]|uniref:Uncharacterized protein n=1 Tax=Perkinsus olseni TaxID=32597 RepID=A0A7J6NEQ2_PEROL|nr:hypothetical protein FOZ60_010822 [Perkinsus olseni]